MSGRQASRRWGLIAVGVGLLFGKILFGALDAVEAANAGSSGEGQPPPISHKPGSSGTTLQTQRSTSPAPASGASPLDTAPVAPATTQVPPDQPILVSTQKPPLSDLVDQKREFKESNSVRFIVLMTAVSGLALLLACLTLFLARNTKQRLMEIERRQQDIEMGGRETSVAMDRDIDKLSINYQKLERQVAELRLALLDTGLEINETGRIISPHTSEHRSEGQLAPEWPAAGYPPASPSPVALKAPSTMPARSPPMTQTQLLEAVQEAADSALADGVATDAAMLTAAVASRMRGVAGSSIWQRFKVCAHNSSAGLVADFNNPDFLSVTSVNGRGWLLPNPRATYAHSFVKYYEGNSNGWPRFAKPATCSLDASGAAILETRGRL